MYMSMCVCMTNIVSTSKSIKCSIPHVSLNVFKLGNSKFTEVKTLNPYKEQYRRPI